MTSLDASICQQANDSTNHHFIKHGRSLGIRFWLVLLVLANLGLLLGNVPASNLMYNPAAVADGQWWRIFTWPLVHVSRYHLLLDGAAFLLLYHGLEEKSALVRLSYVLCAAIGSLLLPLGFSPEIGHLGLCGLSGIAHGLMAISALEMYCSVEHKKLGTLLSGGLLTKTSWELWSGTAFLQNIHLGDIGHPIVTTHAGGVLGGLIGFGLLQAIKKVTSDQFHQGR